MSETIDREYFLSYIKEYFDKLLDVEIDFVISPYESVSDNELIFGHAITDTDDYRAFAEQAEDSYRRFISNFHENMRGGFWKVISPKNRYLS